MFLPLVGRVTRLPAVSERHEASCVISIMKRFFFDLTEEIPARDLLGHECSPKKEAKQHACFIAHRIGTEKPSIAKPGNYISVRDKRGIAFFEAPITSTNREI
jgi:hypothetical protein